MRVLHRTFTGRDFTVAVACVFALVASACAEGHAPESNFGDVGPDAAAGAALATASLGAGEVCADISLTITSPANNATYTYTPGGVAITVGVEVEGVVVGTGLEDYLIQYRLDGIPVNPGIPSAGSYTFPSVEFGRHQLVAHLIDAQGGPVWCEEARAAVYVRVVKPCIFSQGAAQCDDGLSCSSDSCKSQGGGDNGVCTYGGGGGAQCCDSVDECDLGYQCQNGHCVECLADVDCLAGSDVCTSSFCGVDGSCVHEPLPGCCIEDADCDSGDNCTLSVCNGFTNTCEVDPTFEPPGGDLCCNADADCKPSDPCVQYMCYTNTQAQPAYSFCRYGDNFENCCTEDSQCNDGNECTLDICSIAVGDDSGSCVFEADPVLTQCCVTVNDCIDDDPATLDLCEPPNPTIAYNHCQNPPDPNYCGLANPGYSDHPDAIVINEMMIAPGDVPDTVGEFIEFFNASDHVIDMTGWTLDAVSGAGGAGGPETIAEASFNPAGNWASANLGVNALRQTFSVAAPTQMTNATLHLAACSAGGQLNALIRVTNLTTLESWDAPLSGADLPQAGIEPDPFLGSFCDLFFADVKVQYQPIQLAPGTTYALDLIPAGQVDDPSESYIAWSLHQQTSDYAGGDAFDVAADGTVNGVGFDGDDWVFKITNEPLSGYMFKSADKVGGGAVDVHPGQYLVWAREADTTLNGGFNPDGVYASAISLPDLFETGQHQTVTITLRDDVGQIVDLVTYDTLTWGLAIQDGRTTELVHGFADNDQAVTWEASGYNVDPSLNVKYGPPGARIPGSPKVRNKSVLRPIPHASCTSGLDPANPCVFGACSIDSQCEYPLTQGCCTIDEHCADGDGCTENTCDVANGLCNFPIQNPDCCDDDTDCFDGNPCNLDRCIGSVCRYTEALAENCCLNNGDCNDGNECTINTCDVLNKTCEPAIDVVLDGGAQCCTGPQDCDDSDPSTNDFCNFNASPPQCTFVPNPDYCTDVDAPCDDGKLCTSDFCDVASSLCIHQVAPGCCTVNSDCASDGNVCTNEICDSGTGECSITTIADCCLSDQDCQDGDVCTTDVCAGNSCHNSHEAGCCNVTEDCDDGIPCTTDACIDGQCSYPQEEACCTPGASPAALIDSCGPDPDGILTCSVWTCTETGQCLLQENPTCCNEHTDCDDGDPCTNDVCGTNLKCKNLQQTTGSCCVSNADCPADTSVCTSAVCDAGECGQLAIAGCSEPVNHCGVDHGPLVDAASEGWDYGTAGGCWKNDTSGQLGPDAHVECLNSFGEVGDDYVLSTPSFNPSGNDVVHVQFQAAWQNGAGSHQLVVMATQFEGNWANPYILGTVDALDSNEGARWDFPLPNALLVETQVWVGFKVVSDTPSNVIKITLDGVKVAPGGAPFFVTNLNAAKVYDKEEDHLTDGGSATADLDQQVTKVFWVHDPELPNEELTAELTGAPPFIEISQAGPLNLYDVFQIKISINPTTANHIGTYDLILRVTDCGFTDEIPLTVDVGLGAGFVLYGPLGAADEATNGLAALMDANNLTYQRVIDINDVPDFTQVQGIFMTLGAGTNKAVLTNSQAAPIVSYLDSGGAVYLEGSATFAEDPQTLLQARFKVSVALTDGGLPGNMIGRGNWFGQSLSYSILPDVYQDVDWLIPTSGQGARTAFQTELSAKTLITTYEDATNGSRHVASSLLLGHTQAVGATPTEVLNLIVDFMLNGYGSCVSHEQCATGDPCEIAECIGGTCNIEPDLTCEFCQDDGDCDNPGDICLPDGTCIPPEGDEVGEDVTPVQHNCDTTDERIQIVKTVAEFGIIDSVHTKLKLVLEDTQKLGTYEIELKHAGVSVTLMAPDPTNADTVLDIDYPLGKQPVQGSMNDFIGTNVNGDWMLVLHDTTGGAQCATLTEWDLHVEHSPISCASDAECSNGGYCDGDEICNGGTCEQGTAPNCQDGDPCTQNICDPGIGQGAGACFFGIRADSCDGAPCSGAHALDGGDNACGIFDYCQNGNDGGSGACTEVCSTCEFITMGPVETPIPAGSCITETVEIADPSGVFAASVIVQLDVTAPDNGDITARVFSPSNAQAQFLNGTAAGTSNFSTTFPIGFEADFCSLNGVQAEGVWKVQLCNVGAFPGVLHTGSLWINATNVDPTAGNSCGNAIPFSGTDGETLLAGDTTCFANLTTGSCSGAAGHDIVYTFNISTSKRVTAKLDASAFDGAVYLTNSCNPGSSYCKDVAAQGQTETLDHIIDAGLWYLVVDSFAANQKGAYALDVRITTPKPNGQACLDDLDCISAHCANGYCCATGDCCNVASSCPDIYSTDPSCDSASTCQGHRVDATCTSSQCGSVAVDDDSACAADLESDACQLYISVFCNAQQNQADPLCLTFCSTDAHCDPGSHCFEGNNDCRVNLTNGINCGRDEHCASGECVDGVCCDGGCEGLCEQCNKPGQLGECTFRDNATDPEDECQGDATLCDGKCNGLGECVYTADTVACSECTRCSGNGFCNNFIALDQDPDDTCATCTSCDGSGSCQFVPVGADHLEDCADDGAGSCDQNGVCDGSGACQLYVPGTVCVNQTCTDGYVDPNHTCDGLGDCVNPDDVFCSGLKCDDDGTPPGAFNGLVCLDTCAADDSNCVAGYFCDDAAGTECLPKIANGDDCATDHSCASNFCTDGVCCEAACAGACRVCDAPGAEGSCLDRLAFTDPENTDGDAFLTVGPAPVATLTVSAIEMVAQTFTLGSGEVLDQVEVPLCGAGASAQIAVLGTDGGGLPDSGQVIALSEIVVLGGVDLGSCDDDSFEDVRFAFADSVVFDLGVTYAIQLTSDTEVLWYDPDEDLLPGGASYSASDGGPWIDNGWDESFALISGLSTVGCHPYWCNATGNCNTQCSTDVDCQDGFWCNGSQCEAKFDDGVACSAGNQCLSDSCNQQDGICCDQACDSPCLACNLAGSVGTCTFVPTGADPDEECAGTDGTCGGTCNGAGSCQFAPTNTDCGNCEVCNGGGNCVPSLANTDPANDCALCQTCNGSGGCTVQPAGSDFHDDCGGTTPTSCGFNGQCNGSGACAYWGPETSVDGMTCPDTAVWHPGTVCNGSGGVTDPGPASCGQYICDATGGESACRTTCSEHAHCSAGNVCDFNDTDANGRTDDCVAAKPDGGQCSADFECQAGHCQNGFCCAGGDCCFNAGDCSHLVQPAVCLTHIPGLCDGERVDSICDGNFQCQAITVDDDTACAALLCESGGCTGDNYVPERFCNATGQCAVGGTPQSCDDGNVCTIDTCTAGVGCDNSANNDGHNIPCYNGPANTENVGNCSAGTRSCVGGQIGECIGQTLPGTEACGGGADEDCDGLVNEEGASGCGIWYRDNDNDGYGSTDAKCLCAATDPYDAASPTDCDDGNGNAAPNKPENCSTNYDDNCNSVVNEDNALNCSNHYFDGDSDGYGAGSAHCTCGAKDPFDATNNQDCLDTNGDVNPGKAELCNGYDDNCDGALDVIAGNPADSGYQLCGGAANVVNNNVGCSLGNCYIKSCNLYSHDVDGLFGNGCEATEDQYDQAGNGDFCGTGGDQAVNIDSDMYEGEDHYINANILPGGDVDWFRVKPRDGSTQGHGFEFDIRFSINPGHHTDSGEHRFNIYRDGCGTLVCNDKKFFKIRSDFNYTTSCAAHSGGINTGDPGFAYGCGNQNCGSGSENNCGHGSQKCCHTNTAGNNRWFFIKVRHTIGKPMNSNYQLRVSNDKNL